MSTEVEVKKLQVAYRQLLKELHLTQSRYKRLQHENHALKNEVSVLKRGNENG